MQANCIDINQTPALQYPEMKAFRFSLRDDDIKTVPASWSRPSGSRLAAIPRPVRAARAHLCEALTSPLRVEIELVPKSSFLLRINGLSEFAMS
jgi:hypothetical protein